MNVDRREVRNELRAVEEMLREWDPIGVLSNRALPDWPDNTNE